MKKVLLVVSLISVLLLAGCNKNEEVNNNVNNDVPEVTDNLEQQEVIDVKLDDERYKLSDNYYLEHNAGIKFNVGDNFGEELFTLDTPLEFYSNNIKHSIIAKKSDDRYLKLYIDDNEVNTVSQIYSVGIIDIDEEDDFKEIIIRRVVVDSFVSTNIYRVNDNGKLEEVSFGNLNLSGLCYINNQYIFPVYLFGENSLLGNGPVVGYYTYKDGNLIYNDRLLTGEKAINEDGEFALNDIYEFSDTTLYIVKGNNEIEDETLMAVTESEDNPGLRVGEFKVKKFSIDNNNQSGIKMLYDVELLDDAIWSRYENGRYQPISDEIVKSGTIIKGVSIIVFAP